MDALDKLRLLSTASGQEKGEDGGSAKQKDDLRGIILTHAVLPTGKTTTLLKSLLTSVCENDCLYCPMRAGRDFRRMSFQPTEFACTAIDLSRAGLIQGIFLSSGVAGGGIRTQDRLIATAQILRHHLGYRGYIHLKIMPGAEFDQVLASMKVADRVSINLEAPNAIRLPILAPRKIFEKDLMSIIRMVNRIRQTISPTQAWKKRWPSVCTQFVVGGAGESDKELLSTSQDLHRHQHLQRVYFSALTPHAGTPFANHPAIPKMREQRLYQADYLIRDYGFSESELAYNSSGQLPLDRDPKVIWADNHLRHSPIEVNTAERLELQRIPGIGLKGAQAIIHARSIHTIDDLSMLRKIGIQPKRAKDYILLNGQHPIRQLSFSF